MDELRTDPCSLPRLDPAQVKFVESVEVQAGVRFAAVTDVSARDPICMDLADGRFPASTREAVECLQEMTPRGGRVLDLGTHVGSFTLAAAALGYEVVGVEASPRNASLLQASLERNGFDRVRLIHAAVSDRPGTLEFAQGGPYGHVGRPGEGVPTVAVRALRLDDLLSELGWDRVDFIKMDIEGSEVAGLRGMSRLISGPDAAPLFIESNGHTLNFYGQSPLALKTELEACGYENYLVEMGRLCRVRAGDFQPNTCVDYLAVKRTPANLRSYRIDRPLSHEEVVFRIVQTSRSQQAADRAYIARALASAPTDVLASKAVHEEVQRLRQDGDAAVRSAAEAVQLAPAVWSWLAGWHRGMAAIPRPHFRRSPASRAGRTGSRRG